MNVQNMMAELDPKTPIGSGVPTVSAVDAKAAVAFAQKFGPPNVMAFQNGRCLHPVLPTTEHAIAFIEQHAEADIYFSPADLRDAFAGKPKKQDCLGSRWAWVDIDPPKGMTDPYELEAWRGQVLADVLRLDLPQAQEIVFSGRGLWFFWRLPHRLPRAEVEAINFALADRLGGDACHNIDHVARLPNTRNGKTGVVAEVLRSDPEGVTAVELLPSRQPADLPRQSTQTKELGECQPFEDEQSFFSAVEQLACSEDKKQALILSALDPAAANNGREDPIDINDRSAVMFSFAIKAIMADMPPTTVRNCILSPALGPISAHLLDVKKYPSSQRIRAANRQVECAYERALGFGWRPGEANKSASEDEQLDIVSLAPIPSDLPARPWLVEGLLMDGQVGMLTGRGGEGKSLLALQLGVMVASGGEFAWWSSKQQRNVLVLNAEDNLDEQRRRLAAVCQAMGIDPSTLTDRLFTLKSERLVLVHRDPEDGKIKTAPLYGQLLQLIRERQIGLLVVDPLIETHVNLDENSNVDMKELVLHLRALARFVSVPVLIVHHSRKGATGGDQDGARGGSALVNACRTVITIERMADDEHGRIRPPKPKESYARVTGAKSNYAGRIGDRWLELDQFTLPNGDSSPGFRKVAFGEVEQGFDARTWQARDEFLQMVEAGTGKRPWSTATSGPKAPRLDAAVSDRFKFDAKQAHLVIRAFADAGLIKRAQWTGDDRKKSEVWVCVGQDLPTDTAEMLF